jgi:hypothetical protein
MRDITKQAQTDTVAKRCPSVGVTHPVVVVMNSRGASKVLRVPVSAGEPERLNWRMAPPTPVPTADIARSRVVRECEGLLKRPRASRVVAVVRG